LMSISVPHFKLVVELVNSLSYYYPPQNNFVIGSLNIYQSPDLNEYPIEPDIALFKGLYLPVEEQQQTRSWKMILPNRPAPDVVFELCSKETWHEDLDPDKKPLAYNKLGVKEYFAYDPNAPRLWRSNRLGPRLHGWRYRDGQIQKLVPDETTGWLWSEELDSWLGEDGPHLQLYNSAGELRLNQVEVALQREATERIAKEVALQREATERIAREKAQQREATERIAREKAQQREATERIAREKAWAKLRELGIDPESL